MITIVKDDQILRCSQNTYETMYKRLGYTKLEDKEPVAEIVEKIEIKEEPIEQEPEEIVIEEKTITKKNKENTKKGRIGNRKRGE